MKFSIKRIILLVLLLIVGYFAISVARNWDTIQRVFLGGVKVYETEAPAVPTDIKRPAVLVFSKTNAFRHEDAIPAANKLFEQMAKENGWGIYRTENGAAFNSEILSRFDAVISNLQIAIENQSAARSRIIDTDFAQETANLTKGQILQQAGVAMLSQANSMPQSVLSLLQ